MNKHLKNNYKQSFSFALILSYFYLNIPNDAEPIMHFSSGILILTLVAITCFTNVIGYLSSILFLKYYNLGNKYPKLSKYLSFFEKSSLVFIIMEAILGYFVLCLIIFFSLYVMVSPLLK